MSVGKVQREFSIYETFCTLLLNYHLMVHVTIPNTLSRSEQLSNSLKKNTHLT